ncbi:MAG: S1 RNA-binding domain-containing protein, partial [Firmicutes bacterium]|nr:S1 RNA-binding domain-containing protein [Bacillota bacterium]
LAELVKVPPQSIGVGQYQHDVDQKRLAETLAAVVEDAVNAVGVDLNTASSALLSYVAGISSKVALNIVAYRNEHGPFRNREELKKVPKLGPVTFTQCAGFLRIPGGDNPLDNTAVHPESYELAAKLEPHLEENLSAAELKKLAAELAAGFPTVLDIYRALQKPGRDPREDLPGPVFRREVVKMEDLKPGMLLAGIVRNIVDFGAFVDLGVEQDGLLHVSQISTRFVKHPADVLSVGQKVEVKILEVDLKRNRISLSCIKE